MIFCHDYDRVTAFYRDALGLPLVRIEPSHTILDAGGMWLIVHPALEGMDLPSVPSPPRRRESGPIKLMLNIGNIAEAREKAAKMGGKIDPSEAEWPYDAMTCCPGHDPEGNPFDVMQAR